NKCDARTVAACPLPAIEMLGHDQQPAVDLFRNPPQLVLAATHPNSLWIPSRLWLSLFDDSNQRRFTSALDAHACVMRRPWWRVLEPMMLKTTHLGWALILLFITAGCQTGDPARHFIAEMDRKPAAS